MSSRVGKLVVRVVREGGRGRPESWGGGSYSSLSLMTEPDGEYRQELDSPEYHTLRGTAE